MDPQRQPAYKIPPLYACSAIYATFTALFMRINAEMIQ